MNAPKVRAFNLGPALLLQGRTFSFCICSTIKKKFQTRSLFVVVVVVLYDVRSIIYSFILYVYITFVISIRAREENPIGDIICVEFSSFEKPLRGF